MRRPSASRYGRVDLGVARGPLSGSKSRSGSQKRDELKLCREWCDASRIGKKEEEEVENKLVRCESVLDELTGILRHSKTPQMACKVKTKSRVYRICWCKDKTKCDNIDEQDEANCWWEHQGPPTRPACLAEGWQWRRQWQTLDVAQW